MESMKKCKVCHELILEADAKFCPMCGMPQDEFALRLIRQQGRMIIACGHCGGSGACNKGVGIKTCSCEYCIKKAGVILEDPYTIVPCGFCGGSGRMQIKSDIKKDTKQGGRHGERQIRKDRRYQR